jgi:hypothetical protein
MSMVDCQGVFMDRIPMVGCCWTFGHRRLKMCVFVLLGFVHSLGILRES